MPPEVQVLKHNPAASRSPIVRDAVLHLQPMLDLLYSVDHICRKTTSGNLSRSCCCPFCASVKEHMVCRSGGRSKDGRGVKLPSAPYTPHSTGWRQRVISTRGLPIQRPNV